MTAIRFLVAKYIADVQRMEPKNVGVIAWYNGIVDGRFAGESENELKPPKIVAPEQRKGFVKAVQSWRLQFGKPQLPIGGGKDDVLRNSPEFLDALKLYSTRHFMIGEGGHVAAPPSRTLKSVIDELFTQLIDDSAGHDGRHKSALIQACDAILQPLANNVNFHPNAEVPCNTIGLDFPFTYAFGDDPKQPDVLMQAVSVVDADQVGATAMKFRCFVEDDKVISPSQCACLVGELPNTDKMRQRIAMLSRYSTVVSIAHADIARSMLSKMGLPLLNVNA
jgi:hypothetical protein